MVRVRLRVQLHKLLIIRYSNIKFPVKFNSHFVKNHEEIKSNLFEILNDSIFQEIDNRLDLYFLYGVDLFNHQFYWEAHETFEQIWHQIDKKSSKRILIQGLIQLSVALLKMSEKNSDSAKHLFEASRKKLNEHPSKLFKTEDILKKANAFINLRSDSFPQIKLYNYSQLSML